MAEKMKALVFYGKEDIRIEEVPVPTTVKGRVKVKPVWCGICGSDLHEFLGGANMSPGDTPHPITGEKCPVIFGHEFSGIVEEVGEGVKSFKEGDRVCVEPIIWDGTCVSCQNGVHNACDKGGFIGLSGWGGGLSEHCVVPEESLYRVPDNVSLEVGALVEPLAVGWHAVKASPFQKGDTALVLGGGPIGLAVVLALKAKGAGTIIVSEVAQKRKEFAKDFGADYIVDPTQDDVVKRCKEISGGEGPHIAYDAAGTQEGLDAALDAIRVRGTVVNIAIWEDNAKIFPTKLLIKEKRYVGVITYQRGDFQDILDAISSGDLKCESMITKKIKLKDIVEEGFGALIHDKANQVKILVDPSPE